MRWRARDGRAPVSQILEWSGNALQAYDSQRRSGQAPGMAATVAALKYCARSRDIWSGRRIHCDLRQKWGLSRSVVLENILIDMYFKCGGAGEAWQLFQEMPHRNVVSWTSMVLGSVDSGDPEVAWKLFSQMQEQGVVADARSYVAALKACSSLVSRRKFLDENRNLVEKAKALHAQILKAGHESDVFVGSSLVDLYAKLGNLVEARHVFSRMESRDVVSWNAIIAGHAQFGEGELALEFFEKMLEQGFKPSARTYVAAVLACSSLAVREKGTLVDGAVVKLVSLRKGAALHSQLSRDGLLSQLIVSNSLIDFYVKCGSMELAREVFDKMTETSVVSWTSMITGYTHCEQGEISLQLFERMQEKGLVPDARTFVAALKACSKCADGAKEKIVLLDRSRRIYSQLKKAGHETDLFVASTLVDLFAKLGSMVDAQQVFDAVTHRDVVLWNAIISAATQCGKYELSLEFFQRMQDTRNVEPNARTFVAALGACTGLAARSEGETGDEQQMATMLCLTKAMAIHQQLRKNGFETDTFVASSLIDLYSKCGSMPEARDVFDRMASKDVVLWNSIIRGYSQNGHGDLALKTFAAMLGDGFEPNGRTYVAALNACSILAKTEVGKQADDELLLLKGRSIHSLLVISGQEETDVFVGSALIDMYSKCGTMDQAQAVFDRMTEHNVVSWTSLIFGHALNGRGEVALDYFQRMHDEGLEPNARAYIAALKACSGLANQVDEEITSPKVARLHREIIRSGYESEVFVASSLVDAYAKLGKLREAEQVFAKMPRRSVLAWNSIIRGYVQDGKSERALQLFVQMQDQDSRPDAATFVEALKACGNLGALEAGREIHGQARAAGLDVNPGVAASLVWFYGRCGSIAEAQQVFDLAKQDLVSWSSLIAGYSNQSDWKKVLDLFERMLNDQQVAPDKVIFQHVLSALSHGGQVNRAKECFRVMCSDHGIVPDAEHYACLVDALGRANQLEEAVAMAEEIGLEPNVVFWKTVLSGCSKWRNEEVARIALERIAAWDHRGAENYVLVANTFGSCE